MYAPSDTDNPASDLLQRSLAGPEERGRATAALSSFSRDELHTTLVELLDLVDAFVHRLAEHNSISERAVLRSMGIEPDRPRPGDAARRPKRTAPGFGVSERTARDLAIDAGSRLQASTS